MKTDKSSGRQQLTPDPSLNIVSTSYEIHDQNDRHQRTQEKRLSEPINDDSSTMRPVDAAGKSMGQEETILDVGNDDPSMVLAAFTSDINQFPDKGSLSAYLYNATIAGLYEHRFMCLSQYSMFRAYVQNASIMALDFALFADDESVSPWTIFNPFPEPSTNLPYHLRPTDVQLRTYHHPYLDVIASSLLRDNILIATLSDEQEDQLCMDLHSNGSITVWGSQPWSSMGWEVSQDFADRWGWILDAETVRCSDFWRMERGDPPLAIQLPSSE